MKLNEPRSVITIATLLAAFGVLSAVVLVSSRSITVPSTPLAPTEGVLISSVYDVSGLNVPLLFRTHTPIPTLVAIAAVTLIPTGEMLATETRESGAQLPADIVVELINIERAKAGCPIVTVNDLLAAVAQAHATSMAKNDFFDHNSIDGSTPFDRMSSIGYAFSAAGESVAAGYSTPESVTEGWMDSPGHRAIILDCNYTEVGSGYYKLEVDEGNLNYVWYWVLDFGKP